MKDILTSIAIITTLTGCSMFITKDKCAEKGGVWYENHCRLDKDSEKYKKGKAKCVRELEAFVYITDLNGTDAIVRADAGSYYYHDTWILQNAGTGYAFGRRYSIKDSENYCYADTGLVNNTHHYPIAKKVKWNK